MIQIEPIEAFNDNYIWAMIDADKKTTWVVDPGDANPVLEFCIHHNYQLVGILVTHHHYDHCGGVKLLREKFNIPVYGPKHDSIHATHTVQDAEIIFLPECNLHFKILFIPGHTLEHVAFYCEEENLLFCGDTLFSAGCGRIFEGTPQQMYDSLTKLANLPDNTKIYCGHEYTLPNLKFAKLVEPDNSDIDDYLTQTTHYRTEGQPSLPSILGLEKKVNPFLRAAIPAVIESAEHRIGKPIYNTVEVFATIREWKNNT
ncbi:MAG: hydroxyacylglutathione hydrolase [Gammaproteobacteria bacterium]|nr:hydroxyacylglutathione hydrolase [Gammaproteobacteria bacterium]